MFKQCNLLCLFQHLCLGLQFFSCKCTCSQYHDFNVINVPNISNSKYLLSCDRLDDGHMTAEVHRRWGELVPLIAVREGHVTSEG